MRLLLACLLALSTAGPTLAQDDPGDDLRDDAPTQRRSGDDDLSGKRRRRGDDDDAPAAKPARPQPAPQPQPAAPAPRSMRRRSGLATLVLVVPENKEANGTAAQLAGILERFVANQPGYALITGVDAFGAAKLPVDVATHQAKGVAELQQGRQLLGQSRFDDAERHLSTAVAELEASGGYADPKADYGDALANLGACQTLKGDDKAARETFRTLATVDPTATLEGKGMDPTLVTLFRDARKSLQGANTGTLSIYSSPPGGRVVVDGIFRGYAPLSLDRLVVGKHLVKVEKPGSFTWGAVTVVSPTEDTAVKASLKPTPEYAALEDHIEAAAKEMDDKRVGDSTEQLAQRLHLDRLVIARARQAIEECSVEAAVIDFRQNRRLVKKHHTFQGDEFGGLEREVDGFVQKLLTDADDTAQKAESGHGGHDPLDSKSGTEDWYSSEGNNGRDPQLQRQKHKDGKKKKSKDPLDNEDGMEDW